MTYLIKDFNDNEPASPGAVIYVCHTFKPTWDGRWSFNVTTTDEEIPGEDKSIIGFATGDMKFESLPIRRLEVDALENAINSTKASIVSNEISQQIAYATIAGVIIARL